MEGRLALRVLERHINDTALMSFSLAASWSS